jgi:hypothetical protein
MEKRREKTCGAAADLVQYAPNGRGSRPAGTFSRRDPTMSRVVTPPTAQPTSSPPVPHEKIAQRAYEKWLKRGQQHGRDVQDWVEAEMELREEMKRGTITPSGLRR